MNVDCAWIEKNLEGFFCDRLSAEDHRRAISHIESCPHCNQEVEGLRSMDPLVKQLFRTQLAVAAAPRKPRSSFVLGGFATAAIAAAILWVFVLRAPRPSPPQATLDTPQAVTAPAAGPATPEIPKITTPPPAERAKPDITTGGGYSPSTLPASPPPATGQAAQFSVTDAAGYSRTLADYKGHVLIFGVWSSNQPRSVSNLERIYQAFGANPEVRVLGVANERQVKPSNATFPIAYNQGSNLLGTGAQEFVVVDGNGAVLMRGSLLGDSTRLLNSIRTILDQR